MAIPAPSDIAVTPTAAMLVPPMAAEPLLTALANLNYLWQFHRPPLLDVCPTGTVSRNVYVVPVKPSQDTLTYTFQNRLKPDTTSTATIAVDYCTAYSGGGTTWHNLYSDTVGTTAAALLTHTDTAALPRTAVALRFTYTAGAGVLVPHHILVQPTPSTATTGIQTSGFVPFDNGILSLTGAPIHTEFLNRCKLSTLAVLRDRWQCALSFVQCESGVPAKSPAAALGLLALPTVRMFLPMAGDTATIQLQALATVTGGATAALVQVRQVGGVVNEVAQLDADGTIQTASLTLHPQQAGTLDAYADIEIAAASESSYRTDVRAVMGWWRPTE